MGWVKPKLRQEVSKEHRAQAVVSGSDGDGGSLTPESVLTFPGEGSPHGQAQDTGVSAGVPETFYKSAEDSGLVWISSFKPSSSVKFGYFQEGLSI